MGAVVAVGSVVRVGDAVAVGPALSVGSPVSVGLGDGVGLGVGPGVDAAAGPEGVAADVPEFAGPALLGSPLEVPVLVAPEPTGLLLGPAASGVAPAAPLGVGDSVVAASSGDDAGSAGDAAGLAGAVPG